MLFNFDVGDGRNIDSMIERLQDLAAGGFDVAHGSVKDVWRVTPLEIIGEAVVPAVAAL